MLKYIDENYYLNNFSSNFPKDFNRLNIKASSYIKNRTFNRVDNNNIPEEVKYATCLLINLINEEESKINEVGNLKSQSNDGISETYITSNEIKENYKEKKDSVLETYLNGIIGKDGKPLLYLGVC